MFVLCAHGVLGEPATLLYRHVAWPIEHCQPWQFDRCAGAHHVAGLAAPEGTPLGCPHFGHLHSAALREGTRARNPPCLYTTQPLCGRRHVLLLVTHIESTHRADTRSRFQPLLHPLLLLQKLRCCQNMHSAITRGTRGGGAAFPLWAWQAHWHRLPRPELVNHLMLCLLAVARAMPVLVCQPWPLRRKPWSLAGG